MRKFKVSINLIIGSNFENIDDAVKLVAPIKRNFGYYILENKKVI